MIFSKASGGLPTNPALYENCATRDILIVDGG